MLALLARRQPGALDAMRHAEPAWITDKRRDIMEVISFLQFAGVIVSILSVGTAIASVVFAWKANKTAEKANKTAERSAERSTVTGLLAVLYERYLSDTMATALHTVWALYKEQRGEKEASEGIPIEDASAEEFVREINRKPADVQTAVHAVYWFWEQLAIFVNRGLIDEDFALTGFGDPSILGFLYPVDEAWVREKQKTSEYRGYLKQLYDLWQKRKSSWVS